MGAWIETKLYSALYSSFCRTLTWVRGLKRQKKCHFCFLFVSHPYMGAWIETRTGLIAARSIRSHPYMGAWIETGLIY